MSKKRLVTGFRGLTLAPITTNTDTSYVTGAGASLPYAGSMSRTSKESKTDLYYDDDLYAQLREVSGEDVELRVAEVPLSKLETLGLGTYNAETNTLNADFNVTGELFALRFIADTVSGFPFYFNYRVFEITGIRFDNFTTKKESVTVCELIISGVLKRPLLTSAKAFAVMQLAEDGSNQAACTTFLTAAETLPAATPEGE